MKKYEIKLKATETYILTIEAVGQNAARNLVTQWIENQNLSTRLSENLEIDNSIADRVTASHYKDDISIWEITEHLPPTPDHHTRLDIIVDSILEEGLGWTTPSYIFNFIANVDGGDRLYVMLELQRNRALFDENKVNPDKDELPTTYGAINMTFNETMEAWKGYQKKVK